MAVHAIIVRSRVEEMGVCPLTRENSCAKTYGGEECSIGYSKRSCRGRFFLDV